MNISKPSVFHFLMYSHDVSVLGCTCQASIIMLLLGKSEDMERWSVQCESLGQELEQVRGTIWKTAKQPLVRICHSRVVVLFPLVPTSS
jgi:hypothetical protein